MGIPLADPFESSIQFRDLCIKFAGPRRMLPQRLH